MSDQLVKSMMSNMNYINKPFVQKHILQLLRATSGSFQVRDAVRSTTDSWVSFIELVGFVDIARTVHEMLIGIPLMYPNTPAVFLIFYNQEFQVINNVQRNCESGNIIIEKTPSNDQYIRLNFPCFREWKPSAMSLLQLYQHCLSKISSPPLIITKNKYKEKIKVHHQLPQTNEIHKMLKQTVNTKIEEIEGVKESTAMALDKKEQLDYYINRNVFFEVHIPKLQEKMLEESQLIGQQIRDMRKKVVIVGETDNIEACLEITPKDQQKLSIMSEQTALNETEKKVKAMIARKIEDGAKYTDVKKMLKILYESMFQTQTKMLRMSD